MTMRPILILITTIIASDSCNSTVSVDKKEIVKVVADDTLKHAKQKAFFEHALRLKLDPIDKGVDSFEMRIWVSSMFVEHDLIVLKWSNSSWVTRKIRYYKSEDGTTHLINQELKPTITLPSLIDSLLQMNPNQMLSQEEIPNFVDNVADGVTYDLEIASKSSYKLLTYHCPEKFSKTEKNNKKFLDFLLLVDKYFHFWTPIFTM